VGGGAGVVLVVGRLVVANDLRVVANRLKLCCC
jgi:hypothetical protein